MASLTPGILLKLLQHLDDKHVKVAGEHRSALLQVIGIVPSLGDDPWKSRGYYLRVSDSKHSAYVSVSDDDVELILSDKIQLGQFIHVARLDKGSPVPLLRGVKPVPKRRAFIGDPKDLISSDFIMPKRVDSLVAKRNGLVAKKTGLMANKNGLGAKKDGPMANKNGEVTKKLEMRRLSVGPTRKIEGLETRRLSLDSARKGWDRSPGGVKETLSPGGIKVISKSKPGCDTNLHLGPKSKTRGSSNSSLIGSTKCDTNSQLAPKSKPKGSLVRSPGRDSVSLSEKSSPRKGITSLKNSKSITSPLQSKNVFSSPNIVTKKTPIIKDLNLSPSNESQALKCDLKKVTPSFKNWSDSKIVWNSLPSSVHDLGKEVTSYRNNAFMSAVYALEEASASDSIVKCLSIFAELCESSQKEYAGKVVEQFLNLHETMEKSYISIKSLLHRNIELHFMNASSWVQAAVETDLSSFSLYTGNSNTQECYLVMGSPENSPESSPVNKKGWKKESHSGKGNGLKKTENLAENLILSARSWFLNYLECSIKNGFRLKNMEGDSSQRVVLLGQLKRVNQWLGESNNGTDERIERLRKKLYKFLLDHVDSGVFAGS